MKRWPLKKANFWETAPFFRVLLPFAAGILCYYNVAHFILPLSLGLFIIGTAFILYVAIIYGKKTTAPYPALSFALLNILLFFSGTSISCFTDVRNNKTWFGNNLTTGNAYLARISDAPIEKESSWKLPVTMLCAINNGKTIQVCGKAFLYLYKGGAPMLLHKGDTILAPGNWQPIKNAGNPFEFDYATYCRRNNLFYWQSCAVNNIRLYAANDPQSASLTDRAHDWCAAQLDKYITDPKTRGLIQAMLLGDEVNLDEDLRQSYSETGVIHIIAISGGTVAILFMVISGLLWWLRNRRHLWVKYAVALPLVWFYVVMAGAHPSAMRAAAMFSLLALSLLLQKNTNSLNQLFATAFLLLCAQPAWLFSAGFQLSFMAVLSIILFYKPVYNWWSPTYKITRWLWGAVAVSIAVEILIAPLVIYYFHVFPLLSIIANVIAYSFMATVLVSAMAMVALSFIPIIAKAVGIAIIWIVTLFGNMVQWLQNFNPQSFHSIMLTNGELMLAYTSIIGIVLFLMKKQKPALFAGMAAACLLSFSFCSDEWQSLHQVRLVVYNSGKTNHIEYIAGNKYATLNADTGATKKLDDAISAAHIGWQSWRNDASKPANEILHIGGKKILVLNEDINTVNHFPVDYLVINFAAADPIKLQKIFTPTQLIIGNNYTRKQQDKFVRQCALAHIAVHATNKDGAFDFF